MSLEKLKINIQEKKKSVFFCCLVLLCLFLLIWTLGFLNKDVRAQEALTLIDIRPSSVTSNSAVINWRTNLASTSEVNFGTTASYGTSISSNEPVLTHVITLGSLKASTTYHYQVVSKVLSETGEVIESKSSLDRPFTTPSVSDDTTAPKPVMVIIDAVDVSAEFTVTTSKPALITIYYDDDQVDDYAFSKAEPAGTFLSTEHSLIVSLPTPGIRYFYRIKAVDGSGNEYTSGEFSFMASPSGDHVFTTGSCGGVLLGECSGDEFCDPGTGTLRHNCMECGYNCPSGKTCRGGGDCTDDPVLSGTATQCNNSTCYNERGVFNIPADPSCFVSWPKCNANVVVKVKRDRTCDKWLTCKTSLTVTNPKTNKKENLCYSLTACNSLSSTGECDNYIEMPAVNQTFSTPYEIDKIQGLTGSIIAGLDWGEGGKVIQGYFPYSAMSEEGSYIPELNINGNFEKLNPKYSPCPTTGEIPGCDDNKYDKRPWENSPGSYKKEGVTKSSDIITVIEDPLDSSRFNHVLEVNPLSAEFAVQSGARAIVGSTSTSSTYAVSMKMRAASSGDQKISVRFRTASITKQCSKESTKSGDECDSDSNCLPAIEPDVPGVCEETVTSSGTIEMAKQCSKESSAPGLACKKDGDCPGGTCQDLILTAGWKEYAFEAEGTGGETYLEIVSISDPRGIFYVDDVTIKPILKASSNVKLPRSCRLYPKEDSLYCEYTDKDTGLYYKGWYGYCLEKDSQNPNLCVSWWPVDLLSGESDVFGSEVTAGYTDRTPLYYCIESTGNYSETIFDGNYVQSVDESHDCADITKSPLMNKSFEYRRPIKTVITNCRDGGRDGECFYTGDWNGVNSDCDQEGAIEDMADCRNGRAAGICAMCDADGEGKECNISGYHMTISAAAADQYYKWQIDRIDWILQRPSHDDWIPGTSTADGSVFIILDEESSLVPGTNDWYDDWDGTNSNRLTVRVNFDANDKLESFSATMRDGNDGGGAWIAGIVYLREPCTKIVKVVSGAQDKAWASRVSKTSKYSVPGLNYTYNSDFAPFGGALAPDPLDSPEEWSRLYAEAPRNDPNRETKVSQARSGSPYSCVGGCEQKICLGGSKHGQTCLQDKDCPAPAAEPEKHGVCSGVGTCSNTLAPCRYDKECAGGGFCIGGAASYNNPSAISPYYPGPGTITDSADLSNIEGPPYGGNDEQKRCANSSNPGTICSDNSECPNGTCAYPDEYLCTDLSKIIPAPITRYRDKTCWSNADCAGYTCVSRFGQARIARLFAESYSVWWWDPAAKAGKGGYVDDHSGGRCVGGVNVGRMCSVDAECPGGACENRFLFEGWEAPTESCPAGQRPAFPNDYCGIVPKVKNLKLSAGLSAEKESNNKIEITAKSAMVYLQFNTEADAEQLPLKTIYIRWGDEQGVCDNNKDMKCTVHEDCPGSFCNRVCFGGAHHGQYCSDDEDCPGAFCSPNYEPYPFGFAPRSDPAKPHVFTHAYRCDKDVCIYYPKIMIADNWGFCSNYTLRRPTWIEDVDPFQGDCASYQTDLTYWDPVKCHGKCSVSTAPCLSDADCGAGGGVCQGIGSCVDNACQGGPDNGRQCSILEVKLLAPSSE